jgi:hypothetical protein
MRMTGPDAAIIVAKLERPGGGLVMVAGRSPDFDQWIRERVRGVRAQQGRPWPHRWHTTTVMVSGVDAHHQRASDEDATMLMAPTDQPWGLRW